VRVAGLLLATALLAGCGGHKAQSPEQVARAWSAALNRSDDATAGKLFAEGAQVIQDSVVVLRTGSQAYDWNHSLPCGGTIVSVQQQSRGEVLVVFQLKERPGHICDGPGQQAAAIFAVVDGKITVWHQVPPPTPGQSV
jgi:hypothetical protein